MQFSSLYFMVLHNIQEMSYAMKKRETYYRTKMLDICETQDYVYDNLNKSFCALIIYFKFIQWLKKIRYAPKVRLWQ